MQNPILTKLIDVFTSDYPNVQAIVLKGSRLEEQTTDFWSDYDIQIVLSEKGRISEKAFVRTIGNIGTLQGSEKYGGRDNLLFRAILAISGDISILDISICTHRYWMDMGSKATEGKILFGQIEPPQLLGREDADISMESYRGKVEKTWFKIFIAVKKIARDDYLIGVHLILDILREILVIKMILRDKKYNTTIHRFGEKEELPEVFNCPMADRGDKESILDFIDDAAREYDALLCGNLRDYKSRYDAVSEYIGESRKHLG